MIVKQKTKTKAAKSRVATRKAIKKFCKPKKPKVGFVKVGQTRLRHGTSKSEEIWLTNLQVPERSKVIYGFNGKVYIVDGYNATTRTIYEFLGNFFHAHPLQYKKVFDTINPLTKTTYRQLYESTKARFKLFHSLGFRVIYVWESDYKNNRFAQRLYIPGKELV